MNAASPCSIAHQASPSPRELDLADEWRVRRRRCPQDESALIAVEQVDEARVDRARLGEQAHDSVEHVFEIEGRPDRGDDLVEEALSNTRRFR